MGYSHGIKWTDELIKAKVMEVVDGLGLDRMPSRSECEKYFHDRALSNAITRRCGWYNLANEMGLPIKKSETFFAKIHEAKVAEMLREKGFEVQTMPTNFPYDLLVNGSVKIDVKASRLYRGKSGSFYSFQTGKPFATCDFYILLTVDANSISRAMIVPSNQVIENKQISVGEYRSRYHQYTDKWNLISELSEAWDKLTS